MRKALNENPVVQAVLVGVLVLVVGLMLVLRMGGSSDTATEDPATASDPAAAGTTAAPAATDAAATAPTTPTTVPATATGTGDFKAGPGLPKDVVDAYDQGKAVVILIVNEGGIDDHDIEIMVDELRSRADAGVFVTKVKDVSNYSRITEGVDLDRTPALVIVRPKSLTDGPMPTAVVSYGFRGRASVGQALKDALYKGPDDLPYYPR